MIHLDAGAVIGLLDAGDAHDASAVSALADLERSRDHLEMAAGAFAECLVGPSGKGFGRLHGR